MQYKARIKFQTITANTQVQPDGFSSFRVVVRQKTDTVTGTPTVTVNGAWNIGVGDNLDVQLEPYVVMNTPLTLTFSEGAAQRGEIEVKLMLIYYDEV